MKTRPRQYYVGYTTKGTVVSTNLYECKKFMDEEIKNGCVIPQEMSIADERINGTAIFKWCDNAYYMIEYRRYIADTFDAAWSFVFDCDDTTAIECYTGFFAPWRKTI